MQEPQLLVRAKSLRNASTPFEALLWRHLCGSKLGGHKFRRQHVIDNCIVDFFCPAKALIVEIDGATHDPARDALRDRRHDALGYSTIRVTNADVGKHIDAVLAALAKRLSELPDRWSGDAVPHPLTPSGGLFVLSGGQDCPTDPEGDGEC